MLPQAALTFLQAVGKTLTFWKSAQKADSLISYTQTTRVEPICIIDQRALHVSYVTDILQALNSTFAAYYLQAAAISVNVGKIDVGKFLGHLNPDRSVLESHNAALECLCGGPLPAQNDYRYGLPSLYKATTESLPAALPNALEAIHPHFESALKKAGFTDEEIADFHNDWSKGVKTGEEIGQALLVDGPNSARDKGAPWNGAARPYPHEFEPNEYKDDPTQLHDGNEVSRADHEKAEADRKAKHEEAKKAWDAAEQQRVRTTSGQGFGTDLSKDMREAANLAVGRMYTVDITDGGHKASIPVLIRLNTTECDPGLLVHILSDGAKVKNSSAKERWFGYKLKDLEFWKDLVLCQDLIDAHKKALLHDDNGVYGEILRRRRGNATTTAIGFAASGGDFKPSVGTASNLVITTRQTIKELEKELGGKFDSASIRNKVFEKSYLMIVAVIDPDYDHVTFYYRGIDLPTELTVRDLKKVGKDGNDVMELLKMLSAGTAPKF